MSGNAVPTAAGSGLRWTRAVALAAMAWCTASAAHVLGGGDLPSVTVMIAMVAVTAWGLSVTLSRRASALRVALLLAVGQAVMHVSFVISVAWTRTAPASMPNMADMAGHHPPGTAMTATTGSATMVGPAHQMGLLPSFSMLLAHVAAVVVLGRILAHGEKSLFSLLELLAELTRPARQLYRRVVLVLTAALTPADANITAAGVICPAGHGWRLPPQLQVRAVTRRGPPLFSQP